MCFLFIYFLDTVYIQINPDLAWIWLWQYLLYKMDMMVLGVNDFTVTEDDTFGKNSLCFPGTQINCVNSIATFMYNH